MAEGVELFSVFGKILLQDDSVVDKLKSITKEGQTTSSGMSDSFDKIKSAALKLGAVLGVSLGLKTIIDNAAASQLKLAQLDAVLKSTGGSAGISKKELLAFADAQSKITTNSKGTIISAESLMLTFTKVGKDVFPSAMTAAEDMATALHTDVQSSTMQLGKALGNLSLSSKGTVQGISALKKSGVNFSEAEQDQMAVMLKHNDIAGAQKIVIHELATEFGGSAQAAGQTFSGQMTILKNSITGVATSIGTTLMPFLTSFVKSVNDHVPEIKKVITDVINAITPVIKAVITDVSKIALTLFPSLGGAATDAGGKITAIVKGALTDVKGIFDWIANHAELVKVAVIGIGTVFMAYKAISTVISGITGAMKLAQEAQQAWGAITKAFGIIQAAVNLILSANPIGIVVIAIIAVVAAIVLLWNNCTPFRTFILQMWKDIQGAISTAITAIGGFFKDLGTNISDVFNGIKTFFTNIFDWLKTFFKQWGTVILAILVPFIGIPLLIYQNFDKIKAWLKQIWDDAVGGVKGFVTNVSIAIGGIGNIIIHAFDDAIAFIKNLPAQMLQWGKDMIQGLIDGIKSMISAVGDTVKNVASTISSFLHFSVPDTGPLSDADTYGSDFMDLLTDGMQSKLSSVKDMAAKVATTISGTVNSNLTYGNQVMATSNGTSLAASGLSGSNATTSTVDKSTSNSYNIAEMHLHEVNNASDLASQLKSYGRNHK